MAAADELLREAQYAVLCISYGDTRGSRKNAARATSLSRKIIRKYPTSIEAQQAREILARLQGEHFTAPSKNQHTHASPDRSHQHSGAQTNLDQRESAVPTWRDLWSGFMQLRKFNQLMIVAAVVFVLGIFGFFPLMIGVAIYYFARRSRKFNSPEARRSLNQFRKQVDAWLVENRS